LLVNMTKDDVGNAIKQTRKMLDLQEKLP